MSTLAPGDRVGTLADQVLENGEVIPRGVVGDVIGWRGEEVIVQWADGEDDVVVAYLDPGVVRLYGRRQRGE